MIIEGFYGREIHLPEDRLYYPRRGLWLRPEADGSLTLGVTHATVVLVSGFTYLEYVVEEGQEVERDDNVAYAETYKAMQSIETPLAGRILRLNPEIIGEEAYRIDEGHYMDGWIFSLRPREGIRLAAAFADAAAYGESLLRYEYCGKAPAK